MDNKIHTFVVLAYKESQYLEDCVKSVTNQTYISNVVIATTTDNKHIRNIAKKYKLDVIVGKHTTIGGDFDFAIKCGKTKLVTIAHQDDVYDKDYSSLIVKEYKKNNNGLIYFTDYYELRNNKKVYSNMNLMIKRVLLNPIKIKALNNTKFAKRSIIKYGNAICCPAVTFNTDKIEFPLFENHMTCDIDWHAWETLSKKEGSFVFVNKKLMGHRIHEESETTNTIKDDRRTLEDYEIFCRFWPKFIAKALTRFYKNSEKSNKVK